MRLERQRILDRPVGATEVEVVLNEAAILRVATPKPTPAPRPHRRRGTDKPATPASPLVPSVSPGLIPRPHHYRGRLTDAEVLEALRDPNRVPRGEDGTVSIRQAVKALGIGSDRARRLLDEVGLRRPVPTT